MMGAMPEGAPHNSSRPAPEAEYRARLSELAGAEKALSAADRGYVAAKIAIFVAAALLAAWLMKFAPGRLPWLAVPLVIFAISFVLHERVLRRLRRTRQKISFYERSLARIEGRWPGTGRQGEQFLDASHPYARDLDLFGKGGFFELLCTARTSAGEQKLAAWLMAAAPLDEIALRQAAIAELAPRTGFQERMALAGENVQAEGARTPEALAAWGESGQKPVKGNTGMRLLTLALTACWILSVLLWLFGQLDAIPLWHWGAIALAFSAVNAALSYTWHKRVAASAEALEAAGHELPLLAAVFAAIEQQQFTSAKLTSLQARLRSAGAQPSRALAKLNRYRENLLTAQNFLVKVVDPFVFWSQQWVWAAERWRSQYGKSVRDWISAAAEVEALLSLAVFMHEHPDYVFPSFVAVGPYLEAEDLAHPLIRGRAVGNSVRLGDGGSGVRLIIISGPNMAGKSTFTRSVGVNAVLAQAGAPVRARRMALSALQVAASICILDSLQGGLSRFYAEIMRLKQIYDLTGKNLPVLFLLDELLSGTNSHDRRVGTETIVRSLIRHGAIGIVTTHDLALTAIVDTLNGQAANYHFGDTFAEGRLSFNYLLSPGIAESTNAIELMRSIGLTGN